MTWQDARDLAMPVAVAGFVVVKLVRHWSVTRRPDVAGPLIMTILLFSGAMYGMILVDRIHEGGTTAAEHPWIGPLTLLMFPATIFMLWAMFAFRRGIRAEDAARLEAALLARRSASSDAMPTSWPEEMEAVRRDPPLA